MDVVVLLAVVALLAAVVWLVGAPLRGGSTEAVSEREAAHLDGLEVAKEAKYREIRDLELDLRTGKLSPEDHRAEDRRLRAEAVELLRQIDVAGGARDGGARSAGEPG